MMRHRGRAALVYMAVALLAGSGWPAAAEELPFRFLEEAVEGEYTLVCPVAVQGEGELRLAFDATEAHGLSYVELAKGSVALYRVAGASAERVGDPRPVDVAGEYELAVQRRAGRARVIAAGELLIDVPWDAPLGGKVGVAARGGVRPGELLLQPMGSRLP